MLQQEVRGGWSDPAFESVVHLLNARTGLTFGPSAQFSAEAGTRRAMERAGVSDVGTYLEWLHDGKALFADLVDELTVCETFFFRQPAHFELLRKHLLSEIRQRRGPEHRVRAWSAGCASGEEAYSLAILFDQEGILERSYILGTDISRVALEKARAASYGLWSLRGLDDEQLIRRYFNRVGYNEVLKDRVREQVIFIELNLAGRGIQARHLQNFDIIFCRNVLIYFDQQTIARVAERLYETLGDGGWLVTGASDPLLHKYAPFQTVVTNMGAVYRKRGKKGVSV